MHKELLSSAACLKNLRRSETKQLCTVQQTAFLILLASFIGSYNSNYQTNTFYSHSHLPCVLKGQGEPIINLQTPQWSNSQLTDSLNFHKGRNEIPCEHTECYKLFTPCTTPAQHLHFPNWTLETQKPTITIKEKYFINRTENEMLNLVFSHAAFMQQNSITETILYLQHSLHTAQVQTEVHSVLLKTPSFCTKVPSVILKKITEWVGFLHCIPMLDLLFKKLQSLYRPKTLSLTLKKKEKKVKTKI